MKNYTRIPKFLLAGAALVLMSTNAFCWGQKGHDTVARIAENHLTCRAKKQISKLLDGKSIVYWSNWLDNASHTPELAYTSTWHYINIDADETFDNAARNPAGDVVSALDSQIAILKDRNSTDAEKTLALKMVIHLCGDIHCPMHAGHKSDRGGNKVQVQFFKSGRNLHGIFNRDILESGHSWSHTEWAEEVDRKGSYKMNLITAGSPLDWARETHSITTRIYASTPCGAKLSYDYVAEWTPVIEQQLLRGGLRLASILNGIF